jgi:hypothetical protein
MTERLHPEEKRLRKLSAGELADEVGTLKTQIDALEGEAIRRGLRTAIGQHFRIALSPPGTQQRTDKPLLLRVLGIDAAEFAARFCSTVNTGWRLTCTALKPAREAA